MLGRKNNVIILLSIGILVTNVEEITAIRQRDRPQVTLGIKKNRQKINVCLEPLGEYCFKCGVCSKQQLGNFWFLEGKSVSFYLKHLWIIAQPSVTDADNTKTTADRNSHHEKKKKCIMTKVSILPTLICSLNLYQTNISMFVASSLNGFFFLSIAKPVWHFPAYITKDSKAELLVSGGQEISSQWFSGLRLQAWKHQ